jgi:hypothetical protein
MALHIDTSRPDQLKIRFAWSRTEPPGPLSVVGSFNEWTAGLDELTDDDHGERSVTLGLPYGQRFVFRYLAESGNWFDDPDADEITRQGSVIHPVPAPNGG